MKPSVAVALIVSGTILVATPYIYHGIGNAQVMSLMAELHRDVNFQGSMSSWLDLGSYSAGLLMVIIGVVGSLRKDAV